MVKVFIFAFCVVFAPGGLNVPTHKFNDSLVYYVALKKAGVPVEMHLYA